MSDTVQDMGVPLGLKDLTNPRNDANLTGY